jgi:sporulation protein YlmC with PRC-barrel domain
MILSDLLRNEVFESNGKKVGRVIDVRFQLEGGGTPSQARVIGLIVSPRSAASFLGYERTDMTKPIILNAFLRRIHRGSFLVAWADVQRIDETTVVLRPRYERLESSLPGNDD